MNIKFIDRLIIICPSIILIVNRMVREIIWKSNLFSSIRLIAHIIAMGVFLGDKFMNKIFLFLMFIIIIFIQSNIVKDKFIFSILVRDIIFGIKFVIFIIVKM